jgi:hypothetical protein
MGIYIKRSETKGQHTLELAWTKITRVSVKEEEEQSPHSQKKTW